MSNQTKETAREILASVLAMCSVCEEKPAEVRITTVLISDSTVIDTVNVCLACCPQVRINTNAHLREASAL